MSLREFPGLIRQLPQHKPWVIAIGVITVAVFLGACSFGTWTLLRSEENVGDVLPTSTIVKRDISTRDIDSVPMTVADVFPDEQIVATDGAVYPRIGPVQASEDCRGAATRGEVRNLLASMCSQMIRASFVSADSRYFLTAGILNLPSLAEATTFSRQVAAATSESGTLAGYNSDAAVQILYSGPARVTMEVRGHFLLYVVVVRQDGKKLDETDNTGVEIISYDILKKYLRDTVMATWETDTSAMSEPSEAAATG